MLKFGTSGLRGPAAVLDGLEAGRYVRAFVETMREAGHLEAGRHRLFIGRDLRASSPAIAGRVAAAIQAEGCVAIDCGVLPTPALALAAMREGAPAIMVTGSHIPDHLNGLKFYRPDGEIDKADETRIAARLDEARPDVVRPNNSAYELLFFDVNALYLKRYLDFFVNAPLSGLRVAVYQHTSAARDMLVELLSRLGATATPLGRAEGFVPVDTEALRAEDHDLARGWAADPGYDALVSTDGDADRPLIADETGRFLRGDLVGAMTARFLGAEIVVTPVTSNGRLEGAGFSRIVRTRVGSPFVIAGMQAAMAKGEKAVGFEANGGVLLGFDAEIAGKRLAALPTRDAMLPILAVLATRAREQRPLSVLAAEPGFFPAISTRIEHVPAERSAALLAALEAAPDAAAALFGADVGWRADRTDGFRMIAETGEIVHFRASGNAPELRLYVEAAGEGRAADLVNAALTLAGRNGVGAT